MLKIGMLGYGTVGRNVASLLVEKTRGMELRHILRRPGKASGPLMTESIEDILTDPQVDVVVDVLSGAEPSHEYICRALRAGKAVVTANKAAIAPHLREISQLAREVGVPFLYEASAGGGIPWIENIRKTARVDRILAMSGILNGTTNYVIDRMERFDLEFDVALAEAQAQGYAEADPATDISGEDTASKAVISVSAAMGVPLEQTFPVLGIEALRKSFIEELRAEGRTVRHMMLFRRTRNRYAVGVAPVVLPLSAIEASVRDNFNCASLTGDIVGTLKFYGQGAGGRPTADAVLQDLAMLRDGQATPPAEPSSEKLIYDPSLLTGRGFFPGGEDLPGRTLEELAREASARECFMAFLPED